MLYSAFPEYEFFACRRPALVSAGIDCISLWIGVQLVNDFRLSARLEGLKLDCGGWGEVNKVKGTSSISDLK